MDEVAPDTLTPSIPAATLAPLLPLLRSDDTFAEASRIDTLLASTKGRQDVDEE